MRARDRGAPVCASDAAVTRPQASMVANLPRIAVSLALAGGLACRPAVAPSSTAAVVDDGEFVTMAAQGRLRFGMTASDAAAARDESLDVAAEGCHVVAPAGAGTPPRFTWLVVDGVVVRVDVTDAAIVAEGGGRVGMSADELRARYPTVIVEGPHKYEPDSHTWRIGPADAAHFVFELDGSDHVVAWRAGLPPQVDWVERCG